MIERQVIAGQPVTVVYFQPGMIPGDRNNHSLVKLIYDNGIVQFLAPKAKDTTDAFDPNEARDPSGKWTSGGGSSKKSEEPTVSFVSPNTEVHSLSFSQAEQGLQSPRQKLLAGISHKIDTTLGIKDIRVNHVVGAWADGAENSVMTNSASADIQLERAAAAAKAFLANQKAVLLFHPDENGTSFLAQFRVKGKLSEIHEQLLKDGVEFHTLEPRGSDVVVHIYGDNPETLSLAAKSAKGYNATVDVHPGNGEFIGTTKEDGTDAEQRADARAIYQKTIEGVAATGKLPDQWRTQWQNYIDNWERETGEKIGGGELLKGKVKDKRWRFFHFHTKDGVFRLRLKDKGEWVESEHPRGQPGNAGEFAPKGGGSSTTSAPEEAKPRSVKVRHESGSIEEVKLPDNVAEKARHLADDPERYFKISSDADLIPVDKLVQTRARPEGVAHAVDLMAAAYSGEGGKRGPIHVQKLDDGHYLVLDGNSTTTIATAAGWEHLPAIVIPDASYLPKKPLKGSDGHPGLISTALPKGKASEFNQPSLELAKTDDKSFGLHIQVYKDNPAAYPLTKEQLTGSNDEVARHVIDHIKSNLRYIYEHTPEGQRNRTMHWYDGARRLVDEHVKKYKEYNLKDTTVAGVYASLSPNNLWDQNVEQGDRMIDIYCKHRQEPWDKKMDAAVEKISNKTIKKAALSIAGKSYDELDTPSKKGLWIRIYDQSRWPESPTYKSYAKNKPAIQPFHKVTPEGERQEWYTTPVSGLPQSLSWQSMAMMAKAVRILESKGDRDVISKALKGSTPTHKVRSFYNNILDPNSPNKDVTMDTHAVDAAWFMDDPIAVLHNFGNTPQKKGRPAAWVKGTPGSVKTGIGGNYSFNAEAYRELANDLKIQPRQLQSIIWETKREWMVDMTEDNHKRVHDVWEQYRQGNLTQPQAQDKVKQIVDEDAKLTKEERKAIARAKAKARREAKKAAA